jgi:hypothetical protein
MAVLHCPLSRNSFNFLTASACESPAKGLTKAGCLAEGSGRLGIEIRMINKRLSLVQNYASLTDTRMLDRKSESIASLSFRNHVISRIHYIAEAKVVMYRIRASIQGPWLRHIRRAMYIHITNALPLPKSLQPSSGKTPILYERGFSYQMK